MLDLQQTVASVVLDHSECAAVFQRHRIDFCCRGNLSLAEASAGRGLDPARLIEELSGAIAGRSGTSETDPRTLPIPALIERIVSRHHAYLREALPFVQMLATKVGRVHGAKNERLVELDGVVQELVEELVPHLDQEEQILFPALLAAQPDRALIAREFEAMQAEHLAVGALLERARACTGDFQLPPWACKSYRTLFAELEHLEGDVLRHVHLENHVLGPRFLAGEARP